MKTKLQVIALVFAMSLLTGCESHEHTFGKWGDPKLLELNPPWAGKYIQERTCKSCGLIEANVILE